MTEFFIGSIILAEVLFFIYVAVLFLSAVRNALPDWWCNKEFYVGWGAVIVAFVVVAYAIGMVSTR